MSKDLPAFRLGVGDREVEVTLRGVARTAAGSAGPVHPDFLQRVEDAVRRFSAEVETPDPDPSRTVAEAVAEDLGVDVRWVMPLGHSPVDAGVTP